MPCSPSSSVIADDAAAVVPKLGSENQMPGSNLDHGPESTPPLTIGISIDSPVRLSVMVMLSATVPATPPRCPRKSTSKGGSYPRQPLWRQGRPPSLPEIPTLFIKGCCRVIKGCCRGGDGLAAPVWSRGRRVSEPLRRGYLPGRSPGRPNRVPRRCRG